MDATANASFLSYTISNDEFDADTFKTFLGSSGLRCYSGVNVNFSPSETTECSMGMTVCQKTVMGDKSVWRTCGLEVANGCYEGSEAGLDATICQCKTDLCNGSPSWMIHRPPPTIWAIMAFVTICSYFHW